MDFNSKRGEKLGKMRELLEQFSLEGYLVPSWDEYHAGECHTWAKRLEYITAFSGSNGVALITKNQVILMTDGRYLEQANRELQGLDYLIIVQSETCFEKYISKLPVGYDPKLFTRFQLSLFGNLELKKIHENLVDKIWQKDQQETRLSGVFEYGEIYSGRKCEDKIQLCRDFIQKNQCDALFISSALSVNWLLNIRGRDLEHVPIVLTKAIVSPLKVYLFVKNASDFEYLQEWQDMVTVLDENLFEKFIPSLEASRVILDPQTCSVHFIDLLSERFNILELTDPCALPRAIKTDVELRHAKSVHVDDAVALCEAFSGIIDLYEKKQVFTEYDVGTLLTKIRGRAKHYICDSFSSICGFAENSAVVHYRANVESAKTFSQGGIVLIDSGGHYLGATTDVTRNLVLGGVSSREQKSLYTRVLKGHIALASLHFPQGTNGSQLDVLARQYLYELGLDYAHATGHGVGNCLSVHEGPQGISKLSRVVLEPGMIVSNEPGYYRSREYGFRVENLCYIKKSDAFDSFLCFEQLTLLPYCFDLIDFSLLTRPDKVFITSYYSKIKEFVVPKLSTMAKSWCLKEIWSTLSAIQ